MMKHVALVGLILLTIVCGSAFAEDEPQIDFHIESLPLGEALAAFGKQANFDVVYTIDPALKLKRTPAVIGKFTVKQVLQRLLAGSGGDYRKVTADMIVFRIPATATAGAPGLTNVRYVPRIEPEEQIPEALIRGTRSTNADIKRSINDAEPYIVLDRRDIQVSQATDLVSFLTANIPALNPSGGGGQADVTGTSRALDLRGLGQQQTLVLIDGRRMAGMSFGGELQQPDLAVIPLQAIERIEVLPTTASARYGGGATAGVVNIVLHRGEDGSEVSVDGERLSGINAGSNHVYAGLVSSFGDGRGHWSSWASYSHQTPVRTRDWDFVSRGRERISENNPGAFSAVPPVSDLINIRTRDGSALFDDVQGANAYLPRDFDITRDDIDTLKPNTGQFRLALAPTAQLQGGALSNVRAETTVTSLSTMASFEINSRVTSDVDLRYAQTERKALVSGAEYGPFRGAVLPASAPNNVFGRDLLVSMPVSLADGTLATSNRLGRAAAGLGVELTEHWVTRLEYAWSFSSVALDRPILTLDPQALESGEIDIFRSPMWQGAPPILSTLKTTDVHTDVSELSWRIAGTAFSLPAGPAPLTLLAEERRERLAKGSAQELLVSPGGESFFQSLLPEQKQRIDSLYTELRLPLIGNGESASANVLDAQVSLRADRYRADTALYTPGGADSLARSSSSFSAQSWMASIKWQPISTLFFRAHCGTGFLPPSVAQLTLPTAQVLYFPGIADPKRNGELVGAVTIVAGGNPALQPERSESCGAGLVFDAAQAQGLRFSADYTHLEKSQVIYSPTEWLFNDPTAFFDRLPERVTRAPHAADDPFEFGPITKIDASNLNLSRNKISAWDLGVQYASIPTRLGTFKASTFANIQPKFLSKLTSTSPEFNDAGMGSFAPARFRATSSFTLERGAWLFGWNARYTPKYVVSRDLMTLANQGERHVAGQQYHDVYASYSLGDKPLWNAKTHIQIGARNIFQHDPPFDAAALGYYSRFGETEIPSYYLLMRTEF